MLAAGLLVACLLGGPVLAAGAQQGGIPRPQADCDVTVRIMPLGDSITKGSSGEVPNTEPTKQVGYRQYLWDSLQAAGYNVNLVGSLTNGEFYAGFDANHEGHAGYTAAEIATNIYNNAGGANWISTNPPDIILLHIGTNGLTSSAANVESILNEIDEYEADSGSIVTVILARIINRAPPIPLTTTFNNNVEAMAQLRIVDGDVILPVNIETGAGLIYTLYDDQVNPGDMYWNGSNALHPYHTGYQKMAVVWKNSLDALLLDCNHSPVISPDPGDQSNTENDAVSLDIDATDADNDQLTFQAANMPPGLTIDATTGIISGTIGYDAFTGTPYSVRIKVTDNGQLKRSDAASFTWTVANLNRQPELTQPADQTSTEASSPSLQLEASDPDGDGLSFSATGLPDGLTVSPSTGLISGTVSYGAAANSPYTVMVTATDDGSPPEQNSQTFTWEISNTNRPPQVTSPGNQTNVEGAQVNLQVTASDPDGDSFSFSATGLPAGLAINATSGVISGTIGCQAAGSYPVTVTVVDSYNPPLIGEANFIWEVGVANCTPSVQQPDDQSNSEGEVVSLQVDASDPDGQGLTYTAQGLPPSLTIAPNTGEINGVLDYDAHDGSPYTVTVTATDTGGLSDAATFEWGVANTNRAPVLDPIDEQNSLEGDIIDLSVSAADPDADPLEFAAQNLPPGLSISPESGKIGGVITCQSADTYSVIVTVSDQGQPVLSDSQLFTWQVLPGECAVQEKKIYIPILTFRS